MTPKWDHHFLLAALHKAGMSKEVDNLAYKVDNQEV